MSAENIPEVDDWRRREQIVAKFEAAWRRGEKPAIEDYLQAGQGDGKAFLFDLVQVDLENRIQAGEAVRVEIYFQRFPELQTDRQKAVELISREYEFRRQRGAAGTLDEYLARFPCFRQELADLLKASANPRDVPGRDHLHILCPHCHNPIEVVNIPPPGEILCPSCGSSFHLEPRQTTAVSTPDGQCTVGRFKLIDVVGVGAFGQVYKARDPELDRVVAVKIPRAGNFASEADRDRFLREARSVAQLRHPGIVSVHEVGKSEGLPYLVSEYVDGVTLADYLTAHRLPPREVAQLIAAVADALQYAHEQGVIHRDVKPSNIMLETGSGESQPASEVTTRQSSLTTHHPRLMDFGLAKREAGEITMTIDGQVLGTPAYMSPEQARGEAHKVDGRSDVYSLGVILYELLTGELPFRGNKRMLLHQVLHDEPRPPRRLNDNIQRDLQTICLKALAKEPSRRYVGAAELAADLRRFLRGEPILARPVGRTERFWRWCRRNPGLAATTGVAAVATLATLVTLAVAVVFVTQSRDDAVRSEDKALRLAGEKDTLAQRERDLRKQAEQDVAKLAFEQAYAKCLLEGADSGVLWLGTSLGLAHQAEDADLEQSVRHHLAGWSSFLHPLTATFQLQGLVEVTTVAFSPDGKTVLTGSMDGMAQLWEVGTGKALGPQLKHKRPIWAVAFSPNGKTVLTGSGDTTAQVWEAETGKAVGPPLLHQGSVCAVAFSTDGKMVVTGGEDKTARIWGAGTGKAIGPQLQHLETVRAVAFTPDGKTVVTSGYDHMFKLWDMTGRLLAWPRARMPEEVRKPKVQKPEEVQKPEGGRKPGRTTNPADNPGSQTVQTPTSITVPAEEGMLRFAPDTAVAVALSPDGRTVGTAMIDAKDARARLSEVRLSEVGTGKDLGAAFLHSGPVDHVAFSPNGEILLTRSKNTARLWEVGTGKLVGSDLELPDQGAARPAVLAFGPDGKTVLGVGHYGVARQWTIVAGKGVGLSLQHQEAVNTVAFSPDGKSALTESADGTVRLWEVGTGKALGFHLNAQGRVWAVAFSPDGKTVLTGSASKLPGRPGPFSNMDVRENWTVQLWDLGTGKALGLHLKSVKAVALSPDGKSLVTGNDDGTVQVWDVGTGKPVGPPIKLADTIWAVAFGPDGKTVLTRSGREFQHMGDGAYRLNDETVRVWEVGTGKTLGLHLKPVLAAAFSPDGKSVLTGGWDKTARLWDVETGKAIGPALEHQGPVGAVAFSPDGTIVATGSLDQTARLWQAETGKALGPALQHHGSVFAVVFTPDGKAVVTGSRDHTARVWEVRTGKALGPPLHHEGLLEALALSPDGKALLTGGTDHTARLWDVPGPVKGNVERIQLWTQVLTGMELDKHGAIRMLDPRVWQERRQRLMELGGPPMP